MKTVTVIYFSGMGHTAKMAEAVAKGAGSVNDTKVNLISIEGKDVVEGRYKNESVMATLDGSDAVIFGSPTYMGGPAAQFKAFAAETPPRLVSSDRLRDESVRIQDEDVLESAPVIITSRVFDWAKCHSVAHNAGVRLDR